MKGMFYTLEAILATVMILIGIVSIFPIQEQKETIYSDVGRSCLLYLDQNGLLRHYAVNGMEAELASSLRSCLPSVTDFAVKICSVPNCMTSLPSEETIYLTTYLIAGDNAYNKSQIELWVWRR